jgi:hypothetical protein
MVERCSRTRSSTRRSTAGPTGGARRRADDVLVGIAGLGCDVERGQIRHRNLDPHLDRLGGRRPDHLHGTATSQERRHLVDRADRGGQPDPLRGALGEQLVEPLQRQRQVRAALRAGHRVHLVEDHRADAAQRVPGRRGEQQEQRLGRGDQHVRRDTAEPATLIGGGVAGAHADRDARLRQTEPVRGLSDAGQRRPQVAFHIDGERLQRRDVEHTTAGPRILGRGIGGQAVERPEERG